MSQELSAEVKATRIPPDLGGSDEVRQAEISRGTNQAGVRLYNERLILSLIRRHGALPKVEIARLTGLSAQATTVIVKRLEADGLLLKGEPLRGKVGQPAVPFALNPEGAFAFGLKIGRKSSDLLLVDFCANIRAAIHLPHAYPTPEAIKALARDGVADMLAELNDQQRGRLAGFGIAAPFELWNWELEVGAPRDVLDQWRHFDPQGEIAALVPMPVVLCNDATAACAAEQFFGQSWSFRDFLYIFIGAFIGGGLVLDGHLFQGRRGNAGAIGSIPVPHGHGGSQQLIRSASIFALERKLVAAGVDPSPLWRSPQDWGDLGPTLDEWIEDVTTSLAHTILAAHALIDCEAAIIDGAIPSSVRSRIVARTTEHMSALDQQGLFPIRVCEGTIGPEARALGGAALPFLASFARDRDVLFRAQIQGQIQRDESC